MGPNWPCSRLPQQQCWHWTATEGVMNFYKSGLRCEGLPITAASIVSFSLSKSPALQPSFPVHPSLWASWSAVSLCPLPCAAASLWARPLHSSDLTQALSLLQACLSCCPAGAECSCIGCQAQGKVGLLSGCEVQSWLQ